ncbi:MAG: WYL domain-containing protein [Lentisphaerae bacterium]|nr:WYL domain-containing protein [Lentisphaerota bacterium]
MPMQKSQLHRLMRIAALLKENRYPNSKTLIKEFRRIAVEEELEIECGKKTILRDMKILENEFKCPLAFDRARNGYYLKHHGWDFIAPALLDENEMLAAVIGARISEEIFPAPLKNKIRNAVDYLLQNNNPDFLDTANMDGLNILSGLYANIDPEIFQTIFQGWQTNHRVKIAYADWQGELTGRIIEPHTLVFFNNSWYTKAFCHLKKQPRTFALRRIRQAELLTSDFEPDKEIISSVNPDDFLGFEKITNVKLQVKNYTLDRLKSSPLHSKQIIHSDGTVEIPAISKEVLFPFLLSQEGNAVLIEPAYLREEFKKQLREMLAAY